MAYTTINKPNQYFDTQLWTGDNASGRTFTGLGFQPNLIWSKCRNSANYNHVWVNRVRGGNYFLFSNSTLAEDNKSHGEITSWNSDGSTWIDGTNVTYPRAYYNDGAGSALGGSTYISWNWKAGDSAGSTNTNGTITSTVSVSQTSGFSICTFTTSGGSIDTIGHGLGTAPSMIILKSTTNVNNWSIYHKSLGNDKEILFTTGAASTSTVWNNTTPTSTIFNLNLSNFGTSRGAVAYCFAEIKGFSKFGSYTGNKLDDGPFVYTGFKPAFILFKNTVRTDQNWVLQDNKINTYNGAYNFFVPNSTIAQASGSSVAVDFLSNGFKMRGSDDATNDDVLMMYAAFAENPFVSSTFIPTTAR